MRIASSLTNVISLSRYTRNSLLLSTRGRTQEEEPHKTCGEMLRASRRANYLGVCVRGVAPAHVHSEAGGAPWCRVCCVPCAAWSVKKKGGRGGGRAGNGERGRIRVRFREKGAPKGCAKPPARRARRVEAWRRCEGGGGVLPLIRLGPVHLPYI